MVDTDSTQVSDAIRVMICDDHALFRRGLIMVLMVVDHASMAFDGTHLIPVNRYRQVAAALEPELR